MRTPRFQKLRLALEFCSLFVGVPLIYMAGWLPITIMPLLLLMALVCWLMLRKLHQVTLPELVKTKVPPQEWRRIICIYSASIPFLLVLLWFIKPVAIFSLISHHPKIWVLVMIAYPVLSVFPQELIYREFMFKRYAPLFGQDWKMILMSAAAFSFGHIVLHNWPAVALTFLGGMLFARTYQRTSSLIAVAAEHALYGCAVFTLGYGEFFYEGTLHWFQH